VSNPLALLFQHRGLIGRSVASELKYKTAGTSLGLMWLILTPVLLLTVYSVVYLFVFRVRPPNMTEVQYVMYIFCGLVPFLAISEGLMAGLTSLSAHTAMLGSTVFPVEILPVRAVLASQSGLAVGVGVLAICGLLLDTVSIWWLLVPVVVLLQLMFLIGLGWIFALIHLLIKDMQNVLGIVIMILLILSPVAYTPDMLPASLKVVIWANPAAYYVVLYQQILGSGIRPSIVVLAIAMTLSFTVFIVGYAMFRRLKAVLTDYA